jgi:uncharacterized protein YhaN
VETVSRQLDVLTSCVDTQERATAAAELEQEAAHLARSHSEIGRQLEHLLDRRQALSRSVRPSRRPSVDGPLADGELIAGFETVDISLLEQRRTELEHERFRLSGELTDLEEELHDLLEQRDLVDRQRTASLSLRSIEDVQRELTQVQHELQRVAELPAVRWSGGAENDFLVRAAEFLAQLTDGQLVRLQSSLDGRRVLAINRAGVALRPDALAPPERDQLYISFCLAAASIGAEHGVRLPLVLDEPFLRLSVNATAALAAVLDDMGRRGHQVIVITGHPFVVERFRALGVAMREIRELREQPSELIAAETKSTKTTTATKKPRPKRRRDANAA